MTAAVAGWSWSDAAVALAVSAAAGCLTALLGPLTPQSVLSFLRDLGTVPRSHSGQRARGCH
eukprot:m.8481 g.8481  ORF g.8481 m.8481 type:complete len:62 (+) comp3242_c0_seq1:182-367(+)